jgi:hypothetical protein
MMMMNIILTENAMKIENVIYNERDDEFHSKKRDDNNNYQI